MAYNIKLVCIFLHVMIFYEATVIQCQVLKEFVVRLGEPNRLKWEPLEEQLNQRANGIYTYNQNHGGNVKISSEFCFKGNDGKTTYKIDFLQNGDTYPVYAMNNGEASIMPEFEVEKKASGWQVRHTGMGKHAGKWSDISSVIDKEWQKAPQWQQEIAKIFDDSQVDTYNQLCYYSDTLQKYFNVAFYKPNILQSFANYNDAFKTGLNECDNNKHIAVQWSDLGWNRKRPICIRKTVGVRDPPQQPPPQQLRFLMGGQLQSSSAGASLTQCQTRVAECERRLTDSENAKILLIQDQSQLEAVITQLRKEKDDSKKRADAFVNEITALGQSLTQCQAELRAQQLQLEPQELDYINDVVKKTRESLPDAQMWPTSWNNIWDETKSTLDKKALNSDMRRSYPVFHFEALDDIRRFITSKIHRRNTNALEKQFYLGFVYKADDGSLKINIWKYVDRLLFTKSSYFSTTQGNQVYKAVGSPHQVVFKNDDNNFEGHLTYEEMIFNQQSVLSSPTQFINNCRKDNKGIPQQDSEFHEYGIIVGILGPKFHPNNAITSDPLNADKDAFENSLHMSLELFLFEANVRGSSHENRVTAYIVGIDDIQFSQYTDDQRKFVKDAIVRRTMIVLEQASFPYIYAIQFGFDMNGIDASLTGKMVADGNGRKLRDANNHKMQVHFQQPALMLQCKNEDSDDGLNIADEPCLLVTMYAGSSNTLPGNTFWKGDATGSNEIDAAACSTIALTQNPFFNQYISAANTRVLKFNEENGEYFYEHLPETIDMQ